MNDALMSAAITFATGIVGIIAGWRASSHRIAEAERECERLKDHLAISQFELIEIKTRRHNAAVKGAGTKRAMRMELPIKEGVTT
jgi:hypothetical protein